MEFIFMIGIATILFFILMLLFSESFGDNVKEKKTVIIDDYGYSVQNEFMLARQASQGYKRAFIVPDTLENVAYGIRNTENALILNYSQGDFVLRIPSTAGNIHKGNNIIENRNGTVCINC